ncbi:MAG: DUF2157 domain-containing protein [Candidatus Omnitrophica bacterium]|nr:DUF2157 domain-containing protein [Candidatus Omnitrophota bacterium]
MNKKAVQWLYQELPDLVNKGVLQQTAADKLREHYGELRSADKKWFIIILCSVLGASLIGLGIILLFAHNWEQLSRPVRAFLSLLPLVVGQALAFWVLLRRPTSHALKESTATFLSLMVGASVALISQTYNIPGDTADFILSWMLLIVPLVYLMEATIPAAIYVTGISAWAGHFWDSPLQAVLFWPFLAVIVPHFIWSLRQDKYTLRAAILAFVMAVGTCFGAGFSLGRTWFGSWIVIYSSIITLFYLLGVGEFKNISTNWQRPFRILGGIGVFVMMFLLTFRFPWESATGRHHYTQNETSSWSSFPDYFLTLLLVGTAILMFLQCVKRKDVMGSLFGALPLLALMGYAFGGTSAAFSMLLFNVFLLIVSATRITIGIRTNNLGVINTGMFMLAALILARFFDSEINFVIKGLVFISIGMGFLMTNVVILRRRGGAS